MMKFFTLIFCVSICSVLNAQKFDYNRNNPFGSFQYFISDITQGPNDTIWVCNVGGEFAKRIPGVRWEDTTVPGHTDTDFNFILVPNVGEMWISSSNNGLLKFINEELVEHYTAANSDLPNDVIKGISYDSGNGILWIATEGGLASLQGDTWNVYTDQNSDLESNEITALAVADDGTVWVGADKMYSFSSGNWQSYPQSETGLGATIYDLTVGSDNKLWVANDGGISSFDGTMWEKNRSGRANQVAEDKTGKIWSDHFVNGLYIYNGEGNFFFSEDLSDDDFIEGYFDQIFVDSDNHVWTTGFALGLFEITGVPYKAQIDVVKPITCFGDEDAALNVSVLEGTAPFTYQWSPDNIQGKSPTDLPPGDYSVTVTDAEGNAVSDPVTINSSEIMAQTLFTDSTGVSSTVLFFPRGGLSPYEINWSDGGIGRLREELPSGSYTIIVTDANGCEETFTLAFGENSSSENIFSESGFTIQPTVSTGIFNLIQKEFSTLSKIDVNVFDLYGQRVFINQSNDTNTKIDLTGQSPGIFFLKLDLDNQVFTKKIMVIK